MFHPELPRIDGSGQRGDLALEFAHRRSMVARRMGGMEGMEGRHGLVQPALNLGAELCAWLSARVKGCTAWEAWCSVL